MKSELKFVAHRGIFDNKKIIENTISAFQESIKLNYSFELDVQLTKDNKLVVFHDDSLNRLLSNKNLNKRNIQDLTYLEISKYKLLDSSDGIPLFSDVLKLNCDKVFIDIEIKLTKRIKDTVDILIKELSCYKNYSIKSFDPRIVRYIKKNYPSIKAGLLIDYKYDKFIYNLFLHSKFILNYSLCDFVSISKKLLKSKKFLKKINKYPVSIWTITSSDEIDYSSDYTYICNSLPYDIK